MPNIFGLMTNQRIVGHVKYRNTVITGEVTIAHINGTYDVKLSGEDTAYINIPTIFTNPDFEIGECVGIQCNYGDRGNLVIIGRDRKKIQIPKIITFNYV